MLFFSKKVDDITRSYSVLWGNSNEEDDEEGEEQGEEGRDEEEVRRNDEASANFGWLSLVDSVSETCKEPWSTVWNLPIGEFLNYACYAMEKANKIKKQQEEIMRRKQI